MAKAVGKAVVDGRKTCVRCIHFDIQLEQCKLAQQRPPAKVIAYGCPQFLEDDCPF